MSNILKSFSKLCYACKIYCRKQHSYGKLIPHQIRPKPMHLCLISTGQYSTSSDPSLVTCYHDKDPAPLFFSPQIQQILYKLTGFDLDKIFARRFLEHADKEEDYKFLTDEDLKEYMDSSIKEATKLLQMPPVVKVREPIKEVLSYDPALEGLREHKLVFTDISPGESDRQRIIVVRDPDGTLRQADWNERHRMNQIYNPRPGRHIKTPELFKDEGLLQDCLSREEYIFVLDFACSQFEPDDPMFHKVVKETYENINMRSKHELLWSTRHYGPLCFYLAWHRKIDNLLIQFLHKGWLENCTELLKLYYCLKTEGAEAVMDVKKENYINYITNYINEEKTPNKPNLQLALQSYQEAIREKEAFQSTIESSHGL